MSDPREQRVDLTWGGRLAYAMPQIGLNLSGMILAQWLVFTYAPPDDAEPIDGVVPVALVGAGLFAALTLFGRVVDALADPIVGYWSDHTRSRLGRRRPFLLFGTPLLVLSFALLWFPPDPEGVTTANTVWFGVVNAVYWLAFTVVVGPYFALLPEVAPTARARVTLGVVVSLLVVVGNALGAATPVVKQAFDETPAQWLGLTIDGSKAIGLMGALSLLTFLVPVAWLRERERPAEPSPEEQLGLVASMKSAGATPGYWSLIGVSACFQMATALVLGALPYLATQILERPEGVDGMVPAGEGEGFQTVLTLVLFLGALLWMPWLGMLERRFGHKRLLVAAGGVFALGLLAFPSVLFVGDPAPLALALMLLLTFPAACALILPNVVFGEIVDFDEVRVGRRREGIFSGGMALVVKSAIGLSSGALILLLELGNHRDAPNGIVAAYGAAGVLVVLGTVAFKAYPKAEIDAALTGDRSQAFAAGGAAGPPV